MKRNRYRYASMQVCKYVSMQVCKYASMEVHKFASIECMMKINKNTIVHSSYNLHIVFVYKKKIKTFTYKIFSSTHAYSQMESLNTNTPPPLPRQVPLAIFLD